MEIATKVLIALALTAAACGGESTPSATAGTTVTATLSDKGITLDQPSVTSGTVTFKVVNAGTVVHSLIVLKTEVAHDKIQPDAKDASKVDQAGLLRETGQIAVGQSKEFSVKLVAGSYVLVCNEPAHYQLGMHTGFTVK